jgi:hypothetical protein
LIFFDLRIMETEVAIIRKANTIMINKFFVTSKLLTEKRGQEVAVA